MRCRVYRKHLHLNRPGELSDRKKERLERHVRSCAACAALAASIEAADQRISAARGFRGQAPATLTGRVMAAVAAEGRSREASAGFPGFVPQWFSRPAFRVGLAVSAALLVLVLFGQEASVLWRVSRLERRIATLQAGRSTGWVRSAEAAAGISLDGLPVVEKDVSGLTWVSEEWIAVKRSDFNALIRSYNDLLRMNAGLGRWLREKGIDIRSAGGMDPDAVVRALEQDDRIRRAIHQLQTRGGRPWNRI